MMKKLFMLSVVAAALTGCQTTQQQPQLQVVTPVVHDCYYFGNSAKTIPAPSWICTAEANRDEYMRSAVGFSGNTAGGIAHQKNLAIQQGQKELADQVKSEIIVSVKNKTGTLGVDGAAGATQATSADLDSVSNVVLEGVETIRTHRGPDGYFYVQLGLPREVFKQNVENIVDEYSEQQPEVKVQVNTVEQNQKLADEIAEALGM
jgi:ABC-type glycerol-3-phosphate transport system substrate-binding protein